MVIEDPVKYAVEASKPREYSLHELRLTRSQELHDLCVLAAGAPAHLSPTEVSVRVAQIYRELKHTVERGLL